MAKPSSPSDHAMAATLQDVAVTPADPGLAETAVTTAPYAESAPLAGRFKAQAGAADGSGGQAATIGSMSRYTVGVLLGRGGMGEVLSADDKNLDRRVALKRMRGQRSAADAARFLREAKIQARLDHPAIVPIYEIGYDTDGAPFFSMKQLTGQTLDKVLLQPVLDGKLLRKFVDVCLAVEFAHQRGVVHRDLKPSNIMLGDFGEVYVLDWGIARLLDGADPLATTVDLEWGQSDVEAARAVAAGQAQAPPTQLTATGALVGTPGFIAPEQLEGIPASTASDAYALGCILFELLAGESLHPLGTAALTHTLVGDDRDPSVRAPAHEIAPELASLCVAMTDPEPSARPSARVIAERLQHFLDGDRDLKTRQLLASQLVAEAQAHVLEGGDEARAAAMRKAARAISLNPDSIDATAVIATLLQPPTGRLPALLQASVERLEQVEIGNQARVTLWACLPYLLVLPVLLWQGVNDWVWFALLSVTATLQAVVSLYFMRTPSARPVWAPIIVNTLFIGLSARLFGPWLLMPTLAVGIISGLSAFPPLLDRPWLVTGSVLVGAVTPILLEIMDVLAPTWQFVDGGLVSRSGVLRLGEGSMLGLLFAFNASVVLVTGMYSRAIARQRRRAVEALEYQSWHLRQMLPTVSQAHERVAAVTVGCGGKI
ncbi:MAG: serine/threonine protein kinase [Kofleriaceae bacterium]|nr:serine/threonine protein kinase [Kofleriaceae bacterium]